MTCLRYPESDPLGDGQCECCGRPQARKASDPNRMRVLKLHDAGANLVDPCDVHAWDDLVLAGETAVCRCKRDGR